MIDPTPTLQVSRVIRAGAEDLFRAWTDPQELVHWWRQEGPGWSFAGGFALRNRIDIAMSCCLARFQASRSIWKP